MSFVCSLLDVLGFVSCPWISSFWHWYSTFPNIYTFQTRWVSSKARSVIALKKYLQVVAVHLEAMACDIPEAKAYQNILVSFQFLKTIYMMLDYLPIIYSVQGSFNLI
jgi:hypothetical protein